MGFLTHILPRLSFFLLALALLPGVTPAPSDCGPKFATLAEAIQQKPLYRPNSQWLDLPAAARKKLYDLSQISPPRRKALAAATRGSPATTPAQVQYQELVLLHLYDRDAWLKTVSQLPNVEGASAFIAQVLPYLDKNFPTPLREEILQKIGKLYPDLSKANGGPTYMPPRRIADYYFKQLARGDATIRQEIEKGKTPLEALGTYYSQVQRYIDRGPMYDAQKTLALLRETRDALREAKPGDLPAGPSAIYVGGSVPNGRASLKDSDLDYIVNFHLPKHFEDEINRKTTAVAKTFDPESSFKASVLSHDDPNFWARIHPVVFRVTKDKIEMLVYDSNITKLPAYSDRLSGAAAKKAEIQVHRLE